MRRLLVALALIAWMPDALAGEFELPTCVVPSPVVAGGTASVSRFCRGGADSMSAARSAGASAT